MEKQQIGHNGKFTGTLLFIYKYNFDCDYGSHVTFKLHLTLLQGLYFLFLTFCRFIATYKQEKDGKAMNVTSMGNPHAFEVTALGGQYLTWSYDSTTLYWGNFFFFLSLFSFFRFVFFLRFFLYFVFLSFSFSFFVFFIKPHTFEVTAGRMVLRFNYSLLG
jgi:hypothetical protein